MNEVSKMVISDKYQEKQIILRFLPLIWKFGSIFQSIPDSDQLWRSLRHIGMEIAAREAAMNPIIIYSTI